MSALNIPKTAIKAIDRRRRAFFWTGDEVCHGSRCLVAWENVSISKNDGGLGVKNLELQNRCMLMKFINKLFSNEPAPWKQWILRDAASFDTPLMDLNPICGKLLAMNLILTDLSLM